MEITPGYTFADGVTNDWSDINMETAMTSATFSNMQLADFLSTDRPIYKGSSEPSSPVEYQPWFKTGLTGDGTNPVGMLLLRVGGAWEPWANGFVGINNGAAVISAADLLESTALGGSGTQSGYIPVSKVNEVGYAPIGIAAEGAVVGSTLIIITHGFFYYGTMEGTPVNGGALKAGVANGSFNADSQTVSSGCIGRVLDTTKKLCYLTGLLKQ
jgi:hypothetical protein